MTTSSTTISARFNGPPNSGNGGYTAGLLADHIPESSIRTGIKVMLHSPPPLMQDLSVETSSSSASLFDDQQLIASAENTDLDLDVPECPDESSIERAAAGYLMDDSHIQPHCFVCGPRRDHTDGLRIFAAPLTAPWSCVAGFWEPDASLDDGSGRVANEFVWAALDCPGYFAHRNNALMLLGSMTASVLERPAIGQRLVSMGWPLSVSGRKYFSGTALVDESGKVYAKSHQVWIRLAAD